MPPRRQYIVFALRAALLMLRRYDTPRATSAATDAAALARCRRCEMARVRGAAPRHAVSARSRERVV